MGTLAKNPAGVRWINAISLRPRIRYRDGTAPSPEAEAKLHEQAHHHCFIANSVKTEITVQRPED